VARVRRLLNTKKVGHGGTLDPLATGVLPIAVGRATRLLQYLPARKAYQAVIRFGITTSTDDLEGEVLTTCDARHLQPADVEAMLPDFIGTINQTPPMYSAVQIDGQRLYDLARRGKKVEIPTRQVVINQLAVLGWDAARSPHDPSDLVLPELVLSIDCGPGTYIRSLARDMGERLGTGATLAQLSRTASSGFDISGSISLEALEQSLAEETFMPHEVGNAVRQLAAIALPPDLAHRWCMGQKLSLTEAGIVGLSPQQKTTCEPSPPWHPLRVLAADTEKFLGIGEIRTLPKVAEDGSILEELGNVLAPKMVFAAID